jgi:glycosyltransferase involved in cell wall biosynthesis
MSSRVPPLVSVIVPARNAARHIGGCLEALASQTYPRERYEVIVVDNGSSDTTRQVVEDHEVHLLQESSSCSPYPARNLGIDHARGEVLAFTDADCQPLDTWLDRGVACLHAETADLVGGRVMFTFTSTPSLGEMVDALWHLDVRRQILENQAAMTANLFVHRSVFDAIGGFDPRVRSGGDGRWTRRATDAGFALRYAPEAVVRKPARPLGGLLAKAYRVGRGLPAAWLERGVERGAIGPAIAHNVLPPRWSMVRRRIEETQVPGADATVTALWAVSWLVELVRAAGSVHGWFELGRHDRSRRARKMDVRS